MVTQKQDSMALGMLEVSDRVSSSETLLAKQIY